MTRYLGDLVTLCVLVGLCVVYSELVVLFVRYASGE